MNWIATLVTAGAIGSALSCLWATGPMAVGRRAARMLLAAIVGAALGLVWPLTLLLASILGVAVLCGLALGSEDAA